MYCNYYITVYTASTQIVYEMHMDVTSTNVLAITGVLHTFVPH